MKQIAVNKKIEWVHIASPHEQDVKELSRQFPSIHPLILDEILVPSDRAKIENYDDYVFIVYHLPLYNPQTRASRRAEIDIIVTKKSLITASYETLEPLEQFGRDIQKTFGEETKSTAELLYHLIEEMHNFSLRQIKHVEKKVHFVGSQLFKKQDRRLLEEISYIRRDILDISLIAAPQRATLESLVEVGTTFWGTTYKFYFTALLGHFLRINYLLENLRGTVESYSETISQLFQFKTSEVIRRFSIIGFLTFPLLLYSTIALQPKIDSTLIKTPSDFWFTFGIITVLMIVLAFVFRKKGWL